MTDANLTTEERKNWDILLDPLQLGHSLNIGTYIYDSIIHCHIPHIRSFHREILPDFETIHHANIVEPIITMSRIIVSPNVGKIVAYVDDQSG